VTYGGDSGNRIFVLYWRCPLIRVSVIRGSTVFQSHKCVLWDMDSGTTYQAIVKFLILYYVLPKMCVQQNC
jgi:hypothetical protein